LASGESVVAQTNTAGREIIRQELRTASDRWNKYVDLLQRTALSLKDKALKLSSFEEQYNQLLEWTKTTEAKLVVSEPANTLKDKKDMLQHYKVK